MDTSFYYLDEGLFSYYDSIGYIDEQLESPCSNSSDQENFAYFNIKPTKTPVKKVQQRKAANVRERRRMKSINDAFESLRTCIPLTTCSDRRLSKVDTLKYAIKYIGYLSDILSVDDFDGKHGKNPKKQEKIIVRCNITDIACETGDMVNLVGHSLSWNDEKRQRLTEDNKLSTKLWFPGQPSAEDLATLSSLTPEYH